MADEKVEVQAILISEAVRDTLAWIVAHGRLEDFYRIMAPCLSQIGIAAPAKPPANGKDVGDLALHLAVEGQRLFMQRMVVAHAKREAHRKRVEEWREQRRHQNDNHSDNHSDGHGDNHENATVGIGTGEVNNLPLTDPKPVPEPVPVPVPEKGVVGGKEKTETDADFDRFWEAYGHKVKRAAAEAAFAKAKKAQTWPGIDKVLAAVEAWRNSDQWTKDGGQFQPHAATWLNGRQWEDEPPKTPKTAEEAAKEAMDKIWEEPIK